MTSLSGGLERLQDLLIKRALWGIDTGESRELSRLSVEYPDVDLEFVDDTVALLDAMDVPPGTDIPQNVHNAVMASALDATPGIGANGRLGNASSPSPGTALPWLAAAALGLVAMLAWLRPVDVKKSDGPHLSAAATVADFVSGSDPAGRRAHGTVSWDASRQLGQLKMQGVVANDPAQSQYQVWIVDGMRSDRYPVPGGVFDVGDDGRANLWIHPSVRIDDATSFIVTLERAGGAVVTERSRLVASASM